MKHFISEMKLDLPFEHQQQLLGVTMNIGLVTRRTVRIQLGNEDFKISIKSRRQKVLCSHIAKRENRPISLIEHSVNSIGGLIEEITHFYAEYPGHRAKCGDTGIPDAAFYLAQKPFTDPS